MIEVMGKSTKDKTVMFSAGGREILNSRPAMGLWVGMPSSQVVKYSENVYPTTLRVWVGILEVILRYTIVFYSLFT